VLRALSHKKEEFLDAYKTPESDVDTSTEPTVKPVRSILYGVLISIVIWGFISVLWVVIFGAINGINVTHETEVIEAVSKNILYLVIDLILFAFVLFFAGKITAKYAPKKELKYGIILSLIMLAFYFYAFIVANNAAEANTGYPVWYKTTALILSVVAIMCGAKSRMETYKASHVRPQSDLGWTRFTRPCWRR
jgi:multidrug transporter EmrE-like cation transporter